MDDFALFGNSKAQLWEWKSALVERLAVLRLTIHEAQAHVTPVTSGIPWLGFVVYPDHRLVKARKVRFATSRLCRRYDDYRSGRISFAEFDASVGGWINHVRYADTWGCGGSFSNPSCWPRGMFRNAHAASQRVSEQHTSRSATSGAVIRYSMGDE